MTETSSIPTEYYPTLHESAKNVVANAMMHAQCLYLKKTDLSKQTIDADSLELSLEEKSKGHCLQGSAFVLGYISERYMQSPNELFTHGVLLIAYRNKDKPFKGKYANDYYNSYFLVRDIEGYWHAGSPANHESNDPTSSLITPIPPSKELSTVIDYIQNNDGGDLPTAGEIIDKIVNSKTYSHPRVTGSLEHADILNGNKHPTVEAKCIYKLPLIRNRRNEIYCNKRKVKIICYY